MRSCVLVGILVLAAAPFAAADAVTIGASHDATIYSNNPNNSNGAGPGMFSGTDGTAQSLRGLIQFDVAGTVPAGSTITGAQLTLYLGTVAGSGGTGTATIQLHCLQASWGEGTTESSATGIGGTGLGAAAGVGDATWTDRFWSSTSATPWSTPGGDFAATAGASAVVGTTTNVAYNWLSTPTLVADVQGWLNNPGSNDGWLVLNTDEVDMRTFRAFWTREASNASLRPQLQISYTPVPEPGEMFVVTLLALALPRWRETR